MLTATSFLLLPKPSTNALKPNGNGPKLLKPNWPNCVKSWKN